PHGPSAVATPHDSREEISAVLLGFLLPALPQFRLRVSTPNGECELRLSFGDQRRVTPLNQLPVRPAPMPLDVPQVELMIVQDRAHRLVGQIYAALATVT